MHDTLRRRGLTFAAVAAIALAAFGGGIAYATNGSAGDRITGCVKQGDGLLRVVQSSADCKTGESPISWPAGGDRGLPRDLQCAAGVEHRGDRGGDRPGRVPAEGESETPILRFDLPTGTYFVGVTLGAFKNSGNVELLC